MPLFLLGLVLGAISGGGTHLYTHHTALSLTVGVIAAALCWLGSIAAVILLDD